MKPDLYHNASAVRDPVAAKAIREADRQPEHVSKSSGADEIHSRKPGLRGGWPDCVKR